MVNHNYKDAVSYSFKDGDFPPLPSPALPNHCIVCKNVGNPAPNLIKPVHMKKFNVSRGPDTKNFCNTAVCVRNVNVCYNRSHLASHNLNHVPHSASS